MSQRKLPQRSFTGGFLLPVRSSEPLVAILGKRLSVPGVLMSLIRSTRVLLCAAFAAAVAATAAGTDTAESVTADAAAAQSALGQETITRLKKLGAEVRWVDPSKDPVSGPCADMETDFRFHTHWCEHKPSKSAGFEINLVSPGADEKILPEFLRIRPIRGFYLQGMQLTDKSLATIARHPSICGIDLSETNVTDRGLKVIAGLSSLERLSISGTNVSEKGIVFLESLPNLELIDASNSKLSELSLDRGFPKLARIRVSRLPFAQRSAPKSAEVLGTWRGLQFQERGSRH